MPIPHSYPLATSFTSSLNLFNDETVLSYMMTPSLISLTLTPLLMTPSVTIHPAIAPIFGTTKTSLTCA